jgi:hypothetical protein
MKRSIAAVAVTAAIMTAGTAGPAFAAENAHAGHAAQVDMTETSTINKFVWGRYLIIVRYVKDDPLPKRFAMPMTLRAGAQQVATSNQLTTWQRSYQSLARGSIQVFMLKPVAPKVITRVRWSHRPHGWHGWHQWDPWHGWHGWHAHVDTGFGGAAGLVARHRPYTSDPASRSGR